MNKELFFELVKTYRITNELFSSFLEVPRSTAQSWLKNPEKIPLDKISKVCQLLGIKITELIPESKTYIVNSF